MGEFVKFEVKDHIGIVTLTVLPLTLFVSLFVSTWSRSSRA